MEAPVPRKKDVVPISIWFVLISIFLGKVCAGAASIFL